MIDFTKDIVYTVFRYLKADWIILFIGIMLSVTIKVYLSDQSFLNFVKKNSKISILSSIGFGSFTPLCACGTMAVLLSMFITSMPWGPVMAFLVSSPLTSPSQFMFQTSFFGTEFAVAVLISSLVLGLSAGLIAQFLEKRTNFFEGQFKLANHKSEQESKPRSCCTSNITKLDVKIETSNCCTSRLNNQESITRQSNACIIKEPFSKRLKLKQFFMELYNLGVKKVLLYFILFIALGRVVEIIIPKEWIISLFVETNNYSIPLAASIGLPIYVSGSAALPLMKSFMNLGAGQGALLAFLITGKATGLPVIAGMSTILKKRAILFYVAFVYFGGILAGTVYQFILNIGF